MDPAQEEKDRKRSLKFSLIDGGFFSLMDGLTGVFISPYAIFLKSSHVVLSLLASLPDLISSVFQLSAIKVAEIVKSRRDVLIISALLQGLMWLPLLLIPYISKSELQPWLLLIFITIVSMIGSFMSPLWRGMMGDVVHEHERGKYFSKRNQIIALVSFVSAFVAGWILNYFSTKNVLVGFGILFGTAIIARTISALCIMQMKEKPAHVQQKKYTEGIVQFLKNLPKHNYGKFVMFIFFFRIAWAISAPFVALYMLKSIGLSYWHYTILMAAELLAAFISLYVWGKFNDEKGSKHVLLITGILIPLWPVLFILNNNFTYLILIQALSGILWSGFNLAASNFIYDAAEPEKRTRYVAYFNLLTGTGVFLGAITGGLLMSIISIKTVFLVSGAARLGVTLFLLPSIKEMRLIELNIGRSVFSNSVFIKPQNMSFEVIPQQPKPKLPPPKPVKRKPKPVVLAPQEKTILQKKFIENMLENGKK